MTLSSVDLYRYRLPFTSPLRIGGEEKEYRTGLLVRFQSEDGDIGWGDAAPLPGFSEEKLGDVVAAAESLKAQLEGTEVSLEGGLGGVFERLPLSADVPASLRFAVESAGLHLLAEAQHRSMASLFGNHRETIALNALISDPLQEAEEKASAAREAGYQAVKVKVGRAPLREEVACIREMGRVLGEEIALRLDANRAWILEEALAFSEAVSDVPIAYLEEPLTNPDELPAFAAQTSLPLALDETTREKGPSVLDEASFVAAVVLKPTLLGGITVAREWGRRAQQRGVLPVLSAAYESGVGMRVLGMLAASFPDTPVGLSTYERLAADVLTPRLQMRGPVVALEALFSPSVEGDPSHLAPLSAHS